MPKTIILNQTTINPEFSNIDQAAHNTWGSYKHEDVKIIHYYGKYTNQFLPTDKFSTLPADGECLMIGDDLIVGTYDLNYPSDNPVYIGYNNSPIKYTYGGVEYKIDDARGEKFVMALEYCLNNFEFDFIQRISCTSYVDIPKMVNHLNTIPKTKVYNGAKNMYNSEVYFISGHNVLMSRDVVQLLVDHKEEYLQIAYPEDLATGKLIIYDLAYTDFSEQTSKDTFTTVEHDNLLLNENPSIYLYRTRYFHPEVFYNLYKMINGL